MADFEIALMDIETEFEEERELQLLRENALASRGPPGMSDMLLDSFNQLRARLRQPPPTAEAATRATPHPSASALMEQARVSMDAEEAATINSTINEEVVEAERDRLMDDEVEMDVVGMLFSRRGSTRDRGGPSKGRGGPSRGRGGRPGVEGGRPGPEGGRPPQAEA